MRFSLLCSLTHIFLISSRYQPRPVCNKDFVCCLIYGLFHSLLPISIPTFIANPCNVGVLFLSSANQNPPHTFSSFFVLLCVHVQFFLTFFSMFSSKSLLSLVRNSIYCLCHAPFMWHLHLKPMSLSLFVISASTMTVVAITTTTTLLVLTFLGSFA